MKYILLIYGEEAAWADMSPEDMSRIYAEHAAFGEALAAAGAMVGGEELKPSSTATTLRFTNSGVTMTDGPFVETKEQLGGYYVIDVPSLDEALAWARKMPGCGAGAIVEVRPINDVAMPQ